ncbi:hypothetical protein LJC27_03885 [Christensenellaceae bacterium OttesenSCG-928-M15]|nr:hypothetical protein [Christensenellaceae bacterium OttesenSCG-928-M15]
MKNKFLLIIFAAMLLTGFVLLIALPDEELSYSERRLLKQFPAPGFQTVLSGKWMDEFEEYLPDQFPARDAFRNIKANVLFNVFFQSDNNGLYLAEKGHVMKSDYPLDEGSVTRFAQKLNALYEKHLQGKNVYYAIIPDKVRYSGVAQKHLHTDDARMMELLEADIDEHIEQIPLLDVLTLDDYYKTDLHWRQEKLSGVVQRLGEYMDFSVSMEGLAQNVFSPFYGAYYGQIGLNVGADTLVYLTGGNLDAVYVEDIDHPQVHTVYNEDRLGGMDSYDVYLSGATPLTKLTNEAKKNGRHLIIFRDSFTSSLAPLLADAYETITLVDLRYLSSAILEQYIDFQSATDVIFLYGEQMANNSYLLK